MPARYQPERSMESSEPLYASAPCHKGLGKHYAVYPEGIELVINIADEKVFLPWKQVEGVRLVSGGVKEVIFGTLGRRYPLMSLFWCLTLDAGIFSRHLLLKTRSGPVRYFRFTPQDPEQFIAACDTFLRPETSSP